ncbi:HD domain-containing protein [Rhodococcus sp. 66b]|uniref:HD domain-containing protein n=1 Tax=Rhodococcus sp. 66b TaxID=1945511 RepID=UPI0009B9D477|nr:ATP-binding protein [Rhodococcus sp. 66b]OQM78217.1 Chaperone protein HtpG [Rhodococcus sp. 66b]
MSIDELGDSRIEKLASESLNRSSLGNYNLVAARKTLGELLNSIGRTPEFATYTRHDLSHIDALLMAADWIIPEETFKKLTIADALIITLSIYVHDIGMLVTKNEYASRHESDFPTFKSEMLNDESDHGIDFKDRLNALEPDDHEHFLYEEFVRKYHSQRVQSWVSKVSHTQYGKSDEAADLIDSVFQSLDPVIRTDIALIARSHHLDDIHDTKKYNINRAYGGDKNDTANLQYAAIVLRTVDLLHMTRDRTPVVQFRLASPSDPMGQREWRKQQAVRAVRPTIKSDSQSESIEIHATFSNAEGYFALMEYLDYCEGQIKASQSWATETNTRHPHLSHYVFPWNEIDREQVEAQGFERRQFTFTFDQQKVLDLLTGHTLYNDTGVAVREIVQNSIDSVRLRNHIHSESGEHENTSGPDITINFDPDSRFLRILDRGVGMSQEVIERHFLKVGSSSYQTKEFRESNPSFTSISRFGIGVLSAFMIADEVHVASISTNDTIGRQLVLKSVHGRYLIKNFDPGSEIFSRIGKHGTEISMKLRASSEVNKDMKSLLQKWILIPECTIEYIETGHPPEPVGTQDVEEALTSLMSKINFPSHKTRVFTQKEEGISIAIAQSWNKTYKEWEVISSGSSIPDFDQQPLSPFENDLRFAISGVSVQGIRVTENVPGLREGGPIVLVNVTGQNSPRTNVARTDLEAGPSLDHLIKKIYFYLMQTIEEQIPEISQNVSKRLALKEAGHLYSEILSQEGRSMYTKPKIMSDVLKHAPLHPAEIDGVFQSKSSENLERSGFTVLIGPAADDAARFLDWLPEPKGLLTVLKDGGLLKDIQGTRLPLLGNQSALFSYDEHLWKKFEPASIQTLEGGKSLFIRFEKSKNSWSREFPLGPRILASFRQVTDFFDKPREGRYFQSHTSLYCTSDVIELDEDSKLDVVFIGHYRLFLNHTRFAQLYTRISKRYLAGDEYAAGEHATLLYITTWVRPWGFQEEAHARNLETLRGWLDLQENKDWPENSELRIAAEGVSDLISWSAASAWRRRGDSERN